MTHSFYQQTDCGGGEHWYNFISRSVDMHYRAGGVVRGHVAVGCTAGFVLIEGTTDPANTLISTGRRTGLDTDGMVVLHAIDGGNDTRADSMIAYAADGGTIKNVVVAHSEAGSATRPTGPAVSQWGTVDRGGVYTSRNVTISDCITFNIQSGTSYVIDANSAADGCVAAATCREDKDGDNDLGLIDPDNGTLEGYALSQLGEELTRTEMIELFLEQREGNWRHELAMYQVFPWLFHQYMDSEDWVRCNVGE
jgi:hypothetical protein